VAGAELDEAHRAYLLDGDVRIDTAPGRGTTIEVRVPLPAA
jgi:signal transduction histidine kinase